jgi:dipeptidyl-peptidase-3
MAQSVEDCRAIRMSAYLINNKELLDIFGYNENLNLMSDELVYLLYLRLCVAGIWLLERYKPRERELGARRIVGDTSPS